MDELFQPDFEGHDPDAPVRGTGEVKAAVLMSRGALEDMGMDADAFDERDCLNVFMIQ